MPHTYEYPRPALTADCVLFAREEQQWNVLLIQRNQEPFAGRWALPGGFVEEGEDLREAAARELEEETGLKGISLEQLAAFGRPGRDPRGWTVTVAFWAVVESTGRPIRAGDDARQARWFAFSELPPLAFDHDEIVAAAQKRLNDP